MAHIPILTALDLPAVSILPSINSIRWTGDGQVLLLTKSALHILTPELGVGAGKLRSDVKRGVSIHDSSSSDKPKSIGWLRTMIEFDRALTHQWAADCQDWGSVALGCIDPTLWAVTASPSNVSTNTGCVIATLSSLHELTVWGPMKNHHIGEWIKLQDVTQYLKTVHADDPELLRTLQAQITCIEWSSQPDFGFSPAPDLDASFLAAGNKAGRVILFRSVGKSEGDAVMRYVEDIPISDRWISHLSWSNWKTISSGQSRASLACASVDGSIRLLKITQSAQHSASTTAFYPVYQVGQTLEPDEVRICDPDGKGVTGLRWIEDVTKRSILVHFKPGMIYLWSDQSHSHAWHGLRGFKLCTRPSSVGTSSLSLPSGIEYIKHLDTAVLTLSDGSFHVIHSFSSNPSLESAGSDLDMTSESLSRAARSVFFEIDTEANSARDVNCINGMLSYDNAATFVWMHENSRPTDFSYKHDARHITTFVVAQLFSNYPDDQFIRDIGNRFEQAQAACGDSPMRVLNVALLYLRDANEVSRLKSSLLRLLQPSAAEKDCKISIAPYLGQSNADFRQQFRDSLCAHLYGSNALFSKRLKWNLANYCQKRSQDQEMRQLFEQTANDLAAAIMHDVLTIIIRHIQAAATALSHDTKFILRIVDQVFFGSAPDLKEEAEQLAEAAKSMHLVDDANSQRILEEQCPACTLPMPFEGNTIATCLNGHIWARCSITTLILSTPFVRTCVGCGRKALLLSESQITKNDDSNSSWLLESLLDAARRCFLCGGQFVTLN